MIAVIGLILDVLAYLMRRLGGLNELFAAIGRNCLKPFPGAYVHRAD